MPVKYNGPEDVDDEDTLDAILDDYEEDPYGGGYDSECDDD